MRGGRTAPQHHTAVLPASNNRSVTILQTMKEICTRGKPFGDHAPSLTDSCTGNLYATFPRGRSKHHGRNAFQSSKRMIYPFNLNLNVGGKVFQINCLAAAKYPVTRLGRLATCADPAKRLDLCDDYSVQRNEYFFDRDPTVFCYIFHFYRSGVLWIMDELCPLNYVEEIEYWGIHINYSHNCCRTLFHEHQDELKENIKVQRDLQAELERHDHEKHFEGKWLGNWRKKVWDLVENPYSSIPAKIIAILSSFFVLISVVTMCLSTVEELKHLNLYGVSYMERVEHACVIFFSTEYIMRLLSTSDIRRFLKTVLNIVDLIAILPFYVQIIFERFSEEAYVHLHPDDIERMERVGQVGKVLKIIRLMRIFRILKLARHSIGLRAFGFTIRQCYQQVCCLFLFIAMGVFTFSALMHSVEHDIPGTNFTSIPDAWWWAAVSSYFQVMPSYKTMVIHWDDPLPIPQGAS